MVSTRSGRVVSSDTTTTRNTRARSRKDAEDGMEPIAEVGQPEVTSPAPKTGTRSSGIPAAFGSPAAFNLPQTPLQDDLAGTPLQERVVKTVGRTPVAQTPAAAPAMTPTPTAKTPAPAPTPSVKQIASVPLPDDAGAETEPFASSDDEPAVGPSSPIAAPVAEQAATPSAQPRAKAGTSGRLFGFFAVTSILATVLVALVLAPCASPDLYAMVNPAGYQPICNRVADIHSRTSEVFWRTRAEAADLAASLHGQLPPAAKDLLVKLWEPVQQAHAAALPGLQNACTQLEQRLAPLQEQATEAARVASREVYARLGPVLDAALARLSGGSPHATPAAANATPAAAAASPVDFPVSIDAFIALIDPSEQHYARELWLAAGRQIASKHKAVAWVLTCASPADCQHVKGKLFMAASGFVHIDGGAYTEEGSDGTLQRELATYLKASPAGLVLITHPARLHISAIAVLNAALSESGHLQMDGAAVATERALYIILLEPPADSAAAEDGEQATKQWLTSLLEDKGDESAAAIARSFRRRLDAVLPVQSASSDAVTWDSITFAE